MDGSAYFRWAAYLAGVTDEGYATRPFRLGRARRAPLPEILPLWEPILVQSQDSNIGTDTFFDRVAEIRDKEPCDRQRIDFDDFERVYHRHFRRPGRRIDAILYRRRDRAQATDPFGSLFEVVSIGALVPRAEIPRAGMLVAHEGPQMPVALGVIDDALPLLHRRTRSGAMQSRFAAAWWQVEGGLGPGPLVGGQLEAQAGIEAVLGGLGLDTEYHAHRRRAGTLYPNGIETALYRRASHGSVMLDLAGGADATGGAAKIPLLGVQLPPQAFDDTSGKRLEIPLIAGLRWLVAQTLLGGVARRLVINASLGIVAGPKNGRSRLEQMVAQTIADAQAFAAANALADAEEAVTIFFPYGNAYEDRLVARRRLAPGESLDLLVRLQRDDRTASYVEMHLTDLGAMQDPARLQIALTGPQDIAAPSLTLAAGGEQPVNDGAGIEVARLVHVGSTMGPAEPLPDFLQVCFAPTVAVPDGTPTCPAGGWTLCVRNTGDAEADLVAMIQRDDSPFTRKTGARQAYFDHPQAHEWNPVTRDFDGPGDSPITRQGTNSAYTTVKSEQVRSVGGALVRGSDLRPARYSAEGADWSGEGPDLSAVSETSAALPGVRAAGNFSEASARLAGTSTASATAAREMILRIEAGGPVLPSEPTATEEARLGARTVLASDAIRDR